MKRGSRYGDMKIEPASRILKIHAAILATLTFLAWIDARRGWNSDGNVRPFDTRCARPAFKFLWHNVLDDLDA